MQRKYSYGAWPSARPEAEAWLKALRHLLSANRDIWRDQDFYYLSTVDGEAVKAEMRKSKPLSLSPTMLYRTLDTMGVLAPLYGKRLTVKKIDGVLHRVIRLYRDSIDATEMAQRNSACPHVNNGE